MAGTLGMARPLGLAALIALPLLAGCTYEDRGYGGYDYGGTGGYYGDGSPYGYGNGYDYGRPRYGYPYQPRYRYGNPDRYRGDYCYYHHCRWDDDEGD